MKIIFIFLVAFFIGNANSLVITPEKISNTIANHITIEDENHTLKKEDILNNTFKEFSTITNHSYSKSVFWTKEVIQNGSDKRLDLIFRNLRAGTDFIDVFIYDGETLLATHLLGDQRAQKERAILSSKSMFYLSLNPNQKLTIITKYSSWGSMDLFWEILPMDQYSYINGIENILYGVFGGVILALILYNTMLYFSLKEVVFLFYIAQGFSILWFIYSISGLLYLLNIGLDLRFITASSWIAPTLMLLFLIFFILHFFKISQKNKTLERVFYGFAFVLGCFLIVWIYGYIVDESVFVQFSSIYGNFTFILCLFILAVAFGGILKKIDGALYLFTGETLYLLGAIYTIWLLKGGVNIQSWSHFAIPAGVVLEMIFFSLALGSKIKRIKLDLENSKLIALQEEHYTQYGKLVGNISHQWKQPLSYLSNQFIYLNTLQRLEKEESIKDEYLKIAPKLQYTVEMMAEMINHFNDFYTHNDNTTLEVKKEVEQLLKMYEYKTVSHKINITLSCEENLKIELYKISFLQIFMTLLDNSIDQFEACSKQNKMIFIDIVDKEKSLEIIFKDNGGGIKIGLDEIFKPHISSKGSSRGMGLHILKTIITEKLQGTIEAKNTENGAVFTIRLQK